MRLVCHALFFPNRVFFCAFFQPPTLKGKTMTDHNNVYQSRMHSSVSSDIALRRQGAATPDSCGRSAAPCNSVQFDMAAATITTPARILRLPEVMDRVGLRRASIYQHIAAGSFPKQITLGVRAVGWLESEIDAWLAVRINARQLPKS